MKKKYKACFFSPHLDDAVLSCGALIASEAKCGDVLVVTLFGGGENLYKKVRKRKEEEKKSAAILNYETQILEGLDAIYRSLFYRIPFLRTQRAPLAKWLDSKLNQDLSFLLQKIESDSYFVPLGIGGHIDHQITHFLLRNCLSPHQTYFYEDSPYCLKDTHWKNQFSFLNDTQKWHSIVTLLSYELFQKKCEAVLAYSSQIKPLFKTIENFIDLNYQYSNKVLGEKTQPMERVWQCLS